MTPSTPSLKITVTTPALESAFEGMKNSLPNEFIGLFSGTQEAGSILLNELILPPLAETYPFHTTFPSWRLPIGLRVLATIHSHPTPNPRPSEEDLDTFSRMGPVHFISIPPFAARTTYAYLAYGTPTPYSISQKKA